MQISELRLNGLLEPPDYDTISLDHGVQRARHLPIA